MGKHPKSNSMKDTVLVVVLRESCGHFLLGMGR